MTGMTKVSKSQILPLGKKHTAVMLLGYLSEKSPMTRNGLYHYLSKNCSTSLKLLERSGFVRFDAGESRGDDRWTLLPPQGDDLVEVPIDLLKSGATTKQILFWWLIREEMRKNPEQLVTLSQSAIREWFDEASGHTVKHTTANLSIQQALAEPLKRLGWLRYVKGISKHPKYGVANQPNLLDGRKSYAQYVALDSPAQSSAQ